MVELETAMARAREPVVATRAPTRQQESSNWEQSAPETATDTAAAKRQHVPATGPTSPATQTSTGLWSPTACSDANPSAAMESFQVRST